jgi:hypothetical protein
LVWCGVVWCGVVLNSVPYCPENGSNRILWHLEASEPAKREVRIMLFVCNVQEREPFSVVDRFRAFLTPLEPPSGLAQVPKSAVESSFFVK